MAKKRPPPSRPTRRALTDPLRDRIRALGLTAYALGQLAGVDPGVIQRFLTGKRDIRMETADRLAAALGLRLAESSPRRGRAAKVPIEAHTEVEEP